MQWQNQGDVMTFVSRQAQQRTNAAGVPTVYLNGKRWSPGQSVIGIYKKKYLDKKSGKHNFVLKDQNTGGDIVISHCTSLARQMELYNIGERLQVTFVGKEPIQNGPWRGAMATVYQVACDESFKCPPELLAQLTNESAYEEKQFNTPQQQQPVRQQFQQPMYPQTPAPQYQQPMPQYQQPTAPMYPPQQMAYQPQPIPMPQYQQPMQQQFQQPHIPMQPQHMAPNVTTPAQFASQQISQPIEGASQHMEPDAPDEADGFVPRAPTPFDPFA